MPGNPTVQWVTEGVKIHVSPTISRPAPDFATERSMTETQSREQDLNLTTHRQTSSVWERRGWDGTRESLAISRMLVGVGGAALAIQGIRQRTVLGKMLAGLGGSLAWWALTGEGDLSDAKRWFDGVLE